MFQNGKCLVRASNTLDYITVNIFNPKVKYEIKITIEISDATNEGQTDSDEICNSTQKENET
jgi:hypothetical protein